MDADGWRQAKSVLAEALQLPAGERDALVRARCADADLCREVQAYLNEYDEEFLETVLAVADTLDSTSGAEDVAQPDVRPGDRIGPYVVVDRLGEGGMGRVFLGSDTRLERKVALKCLSAPAPAAELRSRILHEARAAARITHPHIAIVHDVVEHGGRPFLVMEYVEGESLASLLKRERLTTERILSMTRQLAAALSAAHATGIVHRDLKPANIQVTRDGSVKILDFGVAHAMSAVRDVPPAAGGVPPAAAATPAVAATTLQADRRVMHPGTPAYMSPEQLFGRPLDQRSDIYSLGIIVYEMATGHRPYATESPIDVVRTLGRGIAGAPDVASDVPEPLSGIVGRMLAVRPDDRYQAASELDAAVVALLAPDASASEARRPASRSRVRTAGRIAAVVVAVPLAIGVLGFLETAAFNLALGRVAPFDRESPGTWMEFGARALFVPVLYQVAFLLIAGALRFLFRVLSLAPRVDRLLTTHRTRTRQLQMRLGLDDPAVLSQAVALAGFVAFVAISAVFWDVIRAWTARINTYPLSQTLPLRPGNRTAYQLYEFTQCALVFLLAGAVVRIARLRARHPARSGAGPFAVVAGLLALSIVVLVLPYRIAFWAEFDRVDVARDRCFVLGEHDPDWLIYCPEHAPPRNRVVRRDDPAIVRLGRQNLFTPPETLH